eukprot:210393-Prymnesium_polylepis.1
MWGFARIVSSPQTGTCTEPLPSEPCPSVETREQRSRPLAHSHSGGVVATVRSQPQPGDASRHEVGVKLPHPLPAVDSDS